MRIRIRIPQVLVVIGVLALGAVGLAALAQYAFDMQPCPWCVLQRFIYIVVGVLALLGALLSNTPRRIAIVLALLATLSGIASALWQQLHAINEASCDLSLAERITTALQLDRMLPQLFIAYAS
ncbi:MAG: disulfide bond formation protein B, partial [Vitreoscilla sp.]